MLSIDGDSEHEQASCKMEWFNIPTQACGARRGGSEFQPGSVCEYPGNVVLEPSPPILGGIPVDILEITFRKSAPMPACQYGKSSYCQINTLAVPMQTVRADTKKFLSKGFPIREEVSPFQQRLDQDKNRAAE